MLEEEERTVKERQAQARGVGASQADGQRVKPIAFWQAQDLMITQAPARASLHWA